MDHVFGVAGALHNRNVILQQVSKSSRELPANAHQITRQLCPVSQTKN
jgi:hypothetical protein